MQEPNARSKLLQAAQRLMLAKGYPATTVDEICHEAGVSKGSFYHFFGSKEELGLAVLEAYYNHSSERIAQGLRGRTGNPLEQALAFVDHLAEIAGELWGNGCLLGNFALDLADTNPTIRSAVSDVFRRVAGDLAQAFEPLCPSDADAECPTAGELAEQFIAVVEGSIVLAKAHGDWGYVTRALERFRRDARRQVGVTA